MYNINFFRNPYKFSYFLYFEGTQSNKWIYIVINGVQQPIYTEYSNHECCSKITSSGMREGTQKRTLDDWQGDGGLRRPYKG